MRRHGRKEDAGQITAHPRVASVVAASAIVLVATAAVSCIQPNTEAIVDDGGTDAGHIAPAEDSAALAAGSSDGPMLPGDSSLPAAQASARDALALSPAAEAGSGPPVRDAGSPDLPPLTPDAPTAPPVDAAPTCTNACVLGEKMCSGGGVEECVTMTDHCTGWGMPIACNSPKICSQSKSTASCSCAEGSTSCGDACVDLHTDTKNCGSCSHDCLGGACQNGQCQPIQLTSSTISAANLALAADSAYVIDYGGGGRLLKISKTDGTISPLAGGGVSGVAVAGSTLYWTVDPSSGAGSGSVMRAALDGGGMVEIATGQDSPGAIAADSSGAYWLNSGTTATDGAVMSMPAGGASPAPIAGQQPRPASIAIDATNVYWFNVGSTDGSDGAIYKSAKVGGSPAPVAEAQPNATGSPFSLFVRSGRVYFTPRGLGNTDGSVRSVSTNGGSVTAYANNQVRPQGVVADDAFVYWVDYGNGNDGLIQKATLTSKVVTQVVGGLANPLDIAVDDTALYYTTTGGPGSPGGLFRLAK